MYLKKRNILIVFIITALLLSTIAFTASADDGISLSAEAAVLYEPVTKTFLITKNENKRLPMASTTKIMTALVALENARLDDTVIIDERAVGIEGSSAYLALGDEYTIEEMLYALLLQSANDAAVAIACSVADTVEGFVDMMNLKCEELGLFDTHFDNPNGLDGDTHYTTAHDLALIAAAAMENQTFKSIVSTYKKSVGEDKSSRFFVNHNKLLKLYDGCNGIKTGFTKKSGRCLVGSAERDGLNFITVTLDAPNDWNDHKMMFDYGYSILESRCLARVGDFSYDIPVVSSDALSIHAENLKEAHAVVSKEGSKIKEYVQLPRFVCAPIKAGDVLGRVIFVNNGETIGSVDIVATEDVSANNKASLFDHIKNLFKKDC